MVDDITNQSVIQSAVIKLTEHQNTTIIQIEYAMIISNWRLYLVNYCDIFLNSSSFTGFTVVFFIAYRLVPKLGMTWTMVVPPLHEKDVFSDIPFMPLSVSFHAKPHVVSTNLKDFSVWYL